MIVRMVARNLGYTKATTFKPKKRKQAQLCTYGLFVQTLDDSLLKNTKGGKEIVHVLVLVSSSHY